MAYGGSRGHWSARSRVASLVPALPVVGSTAAKWTFSRASRIVSVRPTMNSSTRRALDSLARLDLGPWILGIGTFVFGLACLLQRDFAIYWQPVPAGVPFRQPLAYASAVLHMVAGLALLDRRTARMAAQVIVALYLIFAAVYFTTRFPWLGVAEHVAVAVGAATIWARISRARSLHPSRWSTLARVSYGLCSIMFAAAHFLALKLTVQMIPTWMPGDPTFWAMFTGVVHFAVGIALIANRWAILATRVAGLMYFCFAAIVWTPGALAHSVEWLRWAGDGITLAMLGGVWALGDYLSNQASK
jgi:uncharacterized membrane protein